MNAKLILLAALLLPAGCSHLYYRAMEAVGIEKREILVDRVEDARDDQQEAKEQFKTTLERFKELTGFEGGELEEFYDRLADEYEECEDQAENVRDRISAVESTAEALFEEWEDEIEEIGNPDYQRRSRAMLRDTQARSQELLAVMRQAEGSMVPVLAAFKDQVLFLKHNLNAQAIAHLQGVSVEIEQDVDKLVSEMEAAITEADRFLETMENSE